MWVCAERPLRSAGARLGMAFVLCALLSACTAPTAPPTPLVPRVAVPAAPTTVLTTDDPVELAVATTAELYASSPVVVLAGEGDAAAQARAAPTAKRLGVPLLLAPEGDDTVDGTVDVDGVQAQLVRLGAVTVLSVGDAAHSWAQESGVAAEVVTDETILPDVRPPEPRPSVLVLAQDPATQLAATTSAQASGARVAVVPGGDPRRAPSTAYPAGAPDAAHVLALGTGFGTPEVLARRLAVAATGVELPGGGQVLFPGRRIVALYGHPGTPAMGVLGEQGVEAAVRRAQALAAEYQPLVTEPVVPAFEIISTVASTAPGPDGDFSAEASVADLRPWVAAARDAGLYVLLDLQPGRTDFLTQAKRYTELLAQPHVGLALDPEWRLGPQQRHLAQIGSVGIDEVNAVVGWLADLTRDHVLPQKMLMIHQFRLAMVRDRERLDTSRDELSVVLHADGFGTPQLKIETWQTLHQDPPPNIRWGWKNFYDEDRPTFTPALTMQVGPEAPVVVTYQ
jgi:hypothetical protein